MSVSGDLGHSKEAKKREHCCSHSSLGESIETLTVSTCQLGTSGVAHGEKAHCPNGTVRAQVERNPLPGHLSVWR